jgi:hypothetical protein
MKRERMTDPPGRGLADDMIGDDPSPPDARRFDKNGRRLPAPNAPVPEPAPLPTPELDKPA